MTAKVIDITTLTVGTIVDLHLGSHRRSGYNTCNTPEKYLYTLFRRRRSAYIHLFGAGEAGEAGEVFIYTLLELFLVSQNHSQWI